MKILSLLLIVLLLMSAGCTENVRAKSYGGVMQVDLLPGVKFVSATWKDTELWYITRPMRPDEKPETYTLQEQSSFGIIQGKVIFVEHALVTEKQ